MPDIKISNLHKVNKLSEEALIAVIQDNANKVVTVKQLSDTINADQNRLMAKMYDDIKAVSGSANVIRLREVAASHEIRLNKTDGAIRNLHIRVGANAGEIKKIYGKLNDHKSFLIKNERDNILTRRGLAYANIRVDNVIEDMKDFQENIGQLSYRVDGLTNFSYSSYAYLASFIHFDKSQYWGKVGVLGDKTHEEYDYAWNHRNEGEATSYTCTCTCTTTNNKK